MQRHSLNLHNNNIKNKKSKRKIRKYIQRGGDDEIISSKIHTIIQVKTHYSYCDFLVSIAQNNTLLQQILNTILRAKLEFELMCIEKCKDSCNTPIVKTLTASEILAILDNINIKIDVENYNKEYMNIIKYMNIPTLGSPIDMIQLVIIIYNIYMYNSS